MGMSNTTNSQRISVNPSEATPCRITRPMPGKSFVGRLAQLSALWYLDWLLNLPVFLPLQAMKEESK